MSIILCFPTGPRTLHKPDVDTKAEQAEVADRLRRAIEPNRPMTPADQVMVAEAVWRLLERLHQQGVSKARVLREAGIAGENDSTKHLGQYAVNPDWPQPQKNKARLTKKPARYHRILKAAANLASLDEEALLIEVFRATSLNGHDSSRVAAQEFQELASLLQAIGQEIAAKHNLQKYFRDVSRAGVGLSIVNADEDSPEHRLSPEQIELQFSSGMIGQEWPIEFRAKAWDSSEDECSVPPYPSVILGEWQIGDESRFNVAQTDGQDFSRGLAASLNFSASEPDTEFSASAEVCKGEYWVELCLCIIPVGPDMRPEVALRVKVSTCLSSGEYGDESFRVGVMEGVPTTDPTQSQVTMRVDRQGIPFRVWCMSPTVPEPLKHYYSGTPWVFLPVTGMVVQDWFDIKIFNSSERYKIGTDQMPLPMRALGEHLLDHERGDDFSPFRTGTVAAGLDHNITGQPKRGRRNLVDALDGHAGKLTELFREAQASSRAQRQDALKRLESRLRRMRGEGEPPA